MVLFRDKDLPSFDRWPSSNDIWRKSHDGGEVWRGGGCPVVWPEDQVICGERLHREEFLGWVDGEVISVEEEEGFEGGEQHSEDFQLEGFDAKIVRCVCEEVGKDNAFCV